MLKGSYDADVISTVDIIFDQWDLRIEIRIEEMCHNLLKRDLK